MGFMLAAAVFLPAGAFGSPALQDPPLPAREERSSVGLTPLTEMKSEDRYQGEDGGLYGGGKNEPPPAHRAAALGELARIVRLDPRGSPAPDGKIVLLSIGMSNTYGEFQKFEELARKDPALAPGVMPVNGAVGGAGAASWARGAEGVWGTLDLRLREAGVTPEQVQVVWMKHAEPGPDPDRAPLEYARKLKDWEVQILQRLRARFPNLRVGYLSSRIYGGYNAAGLRRVNPEPFAYESGFAVRWLIQDQLKGDPALNYDPRQGPVRSPILLWGPYLWADGVRPRKGDGLTWEREDLGEDGVHPSASGRQKVAERLLGFLKTDPGAARWFVRP